MWAIPRACAKESAVVGLGTALPSRRDQALMINAIGGPNNTQVTDEIKHLEGRYWDAASARLEARRSSQPLAQFLSYRSAIARGN